MKIRQGFVSNSSSSSFVIMVPSIFYDEEQYCPHCGRNNPEFFTIWESLSNDYSGTMFYTKKESLAELEICKKFLEEDVSWIDRIKELIKNPPDGWEIAYVSRGTNDPAAEYLWENTKRKLILLDIDQVKNAVQKKNIEAAEQIKSGRKVSLAFKHSFSPDLPE